MLYFDFARKLHVNIWTLIMNVLGKWIRRLICMGGLEIDCRDRTLHGGLTFLAMLIEGAQKEIICKERRALTECLQTFFH